MDSSFPPNYDSTVFTDDENSSRMSDLDSEKEFNSSRSSDRMSIDERSKPSRKWTSFEQPKLRLQDELMGETSKKKIVKGPERRSVNRRSSLLVRMIVFQLKKYLSLILSCK